jgi:hypothetical protein
MTEDQAKQRFLVLNLVRLLALLLVMAGVANIAGRFLAELSPLLGYALLVFGAADFFAAPILLKRIWQDRDR